MAPAAAPSVVFCTEADVQAILSVDGELEALDDNADGEIDGPEAGYMTQGINYAAARIMAYCQGLYDVTDMTHSWLVNEWASILAAHYVRCRRGNPVPESLKELVFGDGSENNKGVMGELAAVQRQELQLDGIGYRNVPWPAWSNIRVDSRYRLRQARVERPISEQTPTQYAPNIDWFAEFCFEI